jgi:colanic acid/amylovoran biosynthesis protein
MSGFKNKGNEATTKAIINGIVELQRNTRFTILTEDPAYDAFCTFGDERVSFLKNRFNEANFGKLPFVGSCWYYRLIDRLRVSSITTRRCMEAFRRSDAVLSTDDVFSSTYGQLLIHLNQLKTAACFGKPTVLVGHSIGPFENECEYKAFARTMGHVQLVTARESISLRYLEGMRLKNTRIELTADPAFCLEPDTEKIEKIFAAYKIPREKPLVGLAPSQGITSYSRTSYENHFHALQQLILFLTQRLDCHVILIPHAQASNAMYDDRIICESLYREMSFPQDVTVMSLTHSAEEIRAMAGRLVLMIADRMHAAIAGLSQNVPTFVIGYSIKAEGILGDIFGFDMLKDYLFPVTKIDDAKLNERVKNLFDRRKEVETILSKIMPRIKEKAKRNFALIMDAMEQQMR